MGRKRSVRRRRYERPFAKKCKEYFRHFIAFMFSNVGIILLVIAYTVMGAGIFKNIEDKFNFTLADEVRMLRRETALKLYNITYETNPFLHDEEFYRVISNTLLDYQRKVVFSIKQGYDGSNSTEYSEKWSIAGAFLYSLTVITTIGYGNIYPHTGEGKIITIIYAIIGMPLFLLYLSNIGDVMARSFKWIYANCCLCKWCPGVAKRRAERRRRRSQYRYGLSDTEDQSVTSKESWQNTRADRLNMARPSITSEDFTEGGETEDSYDVQSVTVPISICLMIMVGYICGGAILFCRWENWPFLDASYFCFISLSTIGFGDLVPGHQIYGERTDLLEWSFVFCSTYLMVGMALIAMCFNLMQEEVIHKIRTTVRTVKYILRCNR